MSEEINTKNVRNDEIDLLDLFNRIGRTLKRWGQALGRAFLISIVFILKRWLPLGLSIALGIGTSLFFRTTTDAVYTSDLVLQNNTIYTVDMISYINRLHAFCLEGNRLNLANSIYISEQQANNIIDINAFWIIDMGNDLVPDYVDYDNNSDVSDTVNVRMRYRIAIRAKMKSIQDLSIVQNGIIKYIECDSLSQQRNRVRLRQNLELITRLNYDILQLDSLQKVKYFEETRNKLPQDGGQMIFLQEQNTQLLYTDIYDLYKRKQELESEQVLYKGIVTVLSDFSVPARRDNGTLYYGKKIIPLFFCITLLILILLANRKKIKELYLKY